MKIAVMGSGGWGTALALVLLENGHEVTLWSYREEESTILREKRENPMLKGGPLPVYFSRDCRGRPVISQVPRLCTDS